MKWKRIVTKMRIDTRMRINIIVQQSTKWIRWKTQMKLTRWMNEWMKEGMNEWNEVEWE